MAEVTLRHLTKVYPERSGPGVTAVKSIDLQIADRELMVLVGASGCGKSTTLRMIAGLEEISDGTVMIDGRVVNNVPPKDRDIAMVFQNYALYPHMSVRDNLGFGLKMRKVPRGEIAARVRDAAKLLGLEALLDRKPKALSGGQRQRVALGRAIVRQPKVFLFDEPLSNLDAKMRASTRTEIVRLHARLGATMIYVTHDQMEAMTMGDRICVMHEGSILQVAPPLEVYHRPQNLYVAGFIGSPPMNQLRGTVQVDGSVLRFVEENSSDLPLTVILDDALRPALGSWINRPVVLGVRPEDIAATASPGPGYAGRARVELSEPIGAETYVHLTTGAAHLVARLPSSVRHATGAHLPVTFTPDRIRLFDANRGQLIV